MISRRNFIKTSTAAVAGTLAPSLFFNRTYGSQLPIKFGPVSFAVISDLHLDINGKNGMKMSAYSVQCLEDTIKDLNREENLSFVIVLGDLLLDGEVENAEVVKNCLSHLNVPAYVICGNHDYAPANPIKRRAGYHYLSIDDFVSMFEGFGYDKSGKRYYAKQIVQGFRIIGLDACLPGNSGWNGVLPKEQIEWLDNELDEHADELNLVFTHYNLVRWSPDEAVGGPKQNFCIDNEVEVRKLLTKHMNAAPVVLSGHRHVGLNYREENGVNYFVLPSINSYPMRYTVFNISSESLSWKTPMIRLPVNVHLEAKNNLLKAKWWRDSEFKSRNPENDQQFLDFYEMNKFLLGSIKIL